MGMGNTPPHPPGMQQCTGVTLPAPHEPWDPQEQGAGREHPDVLMVVLSDPSPGALSRGAQ